MPKKPWYCQKKVSKKKLEALEEAAKLLEQAAADAFAALWYAQQDYAPKGAQWGIASRIKTKLGYQMMVKLFPPPPSNEKD